MWTSKNNIRLNSWQWWCGHQQGLGKYYRKYESFSHRV